MLAGLLVIAGMTGFVSGGTALILGLSVGSAILAYALGGVVGLLLGAALTGIAATRAARGGAISPISAHSRQATQP